MRRVGKERAGQSQRRKEWDSKQGRLQWSDHQRVDTPMVVMIVPEKKKALARSHWLTKEKLLAVGSTPAPAASITSWKKVCRMNIIEVTHGKNFQNEPISAKCAQNNFIPQLHLQSFRLNQSRWKCCGAQNRTVFCIGREHQAAMTQWLLMYNSDGSAAPRVNQTTASVAKTNSLI